MTSAPHLARPVHLPSAAGRPLFYVARTSPRNEGLSCAHCARERFRLRRCSGGALRRPRTRPCQSERCRQRHLGARNPNRPTPASRRTRSRTHPTPASLAAPTTRQGSRGCPRRARANIPFPAHQRGQIFAPRTQGSTCPSAGARSPVGDPSAVVCCEVAVQAAQPPARSSRTAWGQWLPELSVVVWRMRRTTSRRHDSSASPESHAVTRDGRTEVTKDGTR